VETKTQEEQNAEVKKGDQAEPLDYVQSSLTLLHISLHSYSQSLSAFGRWLG
jgi:hypothetical protein